jgi:ATP-binding cassette subfamily B protein
VTLPRLFQYLQAEKKSLYRATTYSVLNKVADIAPPFLIGIAVDVVVKRENSLMAGFGVTSPLNQLIVLAILTVVVWAFESVFEYLLEWDWRNLAQRVQHNLRLDAYRNVQRLDMSWFSDRKSGRLGSILNDDINQLERFLDGGANDIIQVGTTAVCVGAVFFYFSPMVAFLAILPVPLILWGSFAFQKRIAPRYANVREKASQTLAQLANNIQGMETIKSFTAEEEEVRRIEEHSKSYLEANSDAIRLSALFSPLIRMLIVIGFTGTLIYGGKLCLDGSLAVGSYSVLVFLTQRLLWPLTRLGRTFDLYQRAMASADRILDILDLRPGIVGGDKKLPTHPISIEFSKISFGYDGREELLHEIDFIAKAGETTAIVGPTGAGKSTILRLILRFYQEGKGSIVLDGVDAKEVDITSIRQSTALVSQHVYLFDGSIRDNLCYGRPDASLEELREAAEAAEAASFIMGLPEGYDTQIGERGQKLSGGQRQRLALARAILKQTPILFLDEATSAVDNETEAAIQRSLERIAKNRTVLVIAHRLSTIRNADQIIVLEAGKVVEQGSHESLLLLGGLYSRLWEVQTGEQVS